MSFLLHVQVTINAKMKRENGLNRNLVIITCGILPNTLFSRMVSHSLYAYMPIPDIMGAQRSFGNSVTKLIFSFFVMSVQE